MRVIYALEAVIDFDDLVAFGVATWGENAALCYAEGLETGIARLAAYPQLGRRAETLGREFRRLSVGSHIAFYKIGPDAVKIIRILHASRDPELHIP